jgi:CRP-like cAMP-binding protein
VALHLFDEDAWPRSQGAHRVGLDAALAVAARSRADQTGAESGIQNQHFKAGDYFGEMALLSDQSRNATIQARTALNVLIIRKGDFDKLRPSVHAFGEIFRALAERRRDSRAESAPQRSSIRRILRELEIR